jgi:uncharacterized protein (UPF0335 family)
MATLFEIGVELVALMDLLDETGGEITPNSQDALDEFFTEVGDQQKDKLQAYASLIRRLETEAATATAEAEQWQKKAQARTNSVKSLKDRLKLYLEMTGQKKVQTSKGYTIAIQANGGKVPLVIAEGTDPASLPDEFKRQRWEILTEAVREALESGQKLPFAALGVRGSHVRIR